MDTKIPAVNAVQPVSSEQFSKEIDEVCGDIITVESAVDGHGLQWFLGIDLRDRSKGFIFYFTPPGYCYRSDGEKLRYAERDFHDREELYGTMLHHARLMAANGSTSRLFYEFRNMEEINDGGFDAMEAQ
jgi:hypothetical protein